MGEKQIKGVALCHKGYVREKNEDNLLFLNHNLQMNHEGSTEILFQENIIFHEEALFGVFDGMGGYYNGEEASWITSEIARKTYEKLAKGDDFVPDMLKKICFDANDIICNIMEEKHIKMGSTASMLHFSKEKLFLCNIGDSPIYRFRDTELVPIYKEHTQRAYFEKVVNMDDDEIRKFPLTQCIGISQKEFKISPYLKEIDCQDGDIYLICSDGLSDMVKKKEIANELVKKSSLSDKAKNLMDLALANGGEDNITMILLELCMKDTD